MSPQISAILFLSSSFCVLSLSDSVMANEPLVRRLQATTELPTNFPTRKPTSSNCRISLSGDTSPIANPSPIDMGIIITSVGEHDIDLENGDTNLDADNARIGFCQAKFGPDSKPVYPENANYYNAMKNLCEAMGNGHECYMGLYREDYNGGQSDCDVFRGEDASKTLASAAIGAYGSGWANNQPSCPWMEGEEQESPFYDANEYKHCVTYKTNTNKMLISRCTSSYHIICEFHGECSE